MRRRWADVWGGGAILGVSLLLLSQTLGDQFAHAEVARNPFWFPRLLLVLLTLAAVTMIVRGLATRQKEAGERPLWWRFLLVVAAVGLYLLTFDRAGFLIGSILFVPIFAALLGFRRPILSVVFSILFVSALWFVFADVFIVRPPGPGYDSLMDSLRGDDG